MTAVSGPGVEAGIYYLNVSSSISNGTSVPFVIFSETGLEVLVNTSATIYPKSNATITWTPFAGLNYNASIRIFLALFPSIPIGTIVVPDNGTAVVNMTRFGTLNPGNYIMEVINALGAGDSNEFTVAYPGSLNVTLNTTSVPVGRSIRVQWVPFNPEGLVNVTLLRLSDNSTIALETDAPDANSYVFALPYPAGAYKIFVNNTLSSGVSPMFEITSPLNTSAVPNNISSINGVSVISWTPYDTFQPFVNISIRNSTGLVTLLLVPNLGNYSLNATALGLSPALYSANVTSAIGSGNTTFTVYSATGLNVTAPNATSIIYNNTAATLVQWTPFDNTTQNVTISFINQNTFQNYTVSKLANTGSATVNISALNLIAGTYNVSVASDLGYGVSSFFVIRYPQYLNITSPNVTTNVSDVGILGIDWVPTNPAGGDVTIYMYEYGNTSVTYGPFTTADDGDAILNLGTITKSNLVDSIFPKYAQDADDVAAPGLLNPKKVEKMA